jgi:hypothetical protein
VFCLSVFLFDLCALVRALFCLGATGSSDFPRFLFLVNHGRGGGGSPVTAMACFGAFIGVKPVMICSLHLISYRMIIRSEYLLLGSGPATPSTIRHDLFCPFHKYLQVKARGSDNEKECRCDVIIDVSSEMKDIKEMMLDQPSGTSHGAKAGAIQSLLP